MARDQPLARAEFQCDSSAKQDLGLADLWHVLLGSASSPVKVSTGKPKQSAGSFWEGIQLTTRHVKFIVLCCFFPISEAFLMMGLFIQGCSVALGQGLAFLEPYLLLNKSLKRTALLHLCP